MHTYVLSLGSNIDPERHFQAALELLEKEQELLGVSRFIYTEPDGFKDQPDFLNAAVCVQSSLDPVAFKNYLRGIEDRLGRVRTANRSGPRTMDLDIIMHNGIVLHTDYPAKDYVRIPVDELLADLKERGL